MQNERIGTTEGAKRLERENVGEEGGKPQGGMWKKRAQRGGGMEGTNKKVGNRIR